MPSSPVANTTSLVSRSQTEAFAGKARVALSQMRHWLRGDGAPPPPHEPPYAWALVAAPHRGALRDGD